MADDRVFLFSGTKDSVVNPITMTALQEYYSYFINSRQILTDFTFPAEHCFPSVDYGEPCNTLDSPYIGACSYDAAYKSLTQIYYGTKLAAGYAIPSNLKSFDQTPYFSGLSTSIGDVGYIYIPTACAAMGPCKLHIAYHGCLQTLDDIGNAFAANAGYNSWAEANNIIVVYPYTIKNSRLGNPNGCWDWWGYTTANYAYKTGDQMLFSKRIIDALIK